MQNEYIKSPINYMGNKYKLLGQLFEFFPTNIETFIDVFGGSFTVGININAKNVIYNEINNPLYSLITFLIDHNFDYIDKSLNCLINYYGLEKGKKESYLKLRNDYNDIVKTNSNDEKKDLLLFLLICYGFNYQLRFNKKGEFNIPCGNRDYSNEMKKHLEKFTIKVKDINIQTFNLNYKKLIIPENSFVYLDPPYLQTLATYNENGGWNIEKEKELYKWIDDLNDRNIKFALSNTSFYHNKKNDILLDWATKYDIINLNHNYNNNNRHNKNNNDYTQEILIKNY